MTEDGFRLIARRFARFGSLGPDDLAALGRLAEGAEAVGPRRMVFAEGRRCRMLYLIVEGWVAEHRLLADGGRQILRVRLPGEIFGLECLAYGVSLHGVQTLTPCRLAPVTPEAYRTLQQGHPRIAEALFLMGLFERAVAHEWTVSLGRRPAWSRIAHLILELAERCKVSGLAEEGIPLPLTQQDMADCTGLTLGYVNRVLRDMRERGLIDLAPHDLVIRDRAALARFAGFRPRYLYPTPAPARSGATDGAASEPAGPGADMAEIHAAAAWITASGRP